LRTVLCGLRSGSRIGASLMANYRFSVMRHAKSDWYSGEQEDFLRPLSERGIRDARRMGRWMAEQDRLPEWIVCSPARRTRESLALFGEGAKVELSGRTEWVDALYGGSLEAILKVLGTQNRRQDLLLLGHNPGVEELIRYLVAELPRSRINKLFPTGAIYILETACRFDKLERGCASVVAHQRPKALAD
jgi:phosphohistidine phosphatase